MGPLRAAGLLDHAAATQENQPGPTQRRRLRHLYVAAHPAGRLRIRARHGRHRVLAVVNLTGQPQQFQTPAEAATYPDAFAGAGGPVREQFVQVPAHGWRVRVARQRTGCADFVVRNS